MAILKFHRVVILAVFTSVPSLALPLGAFKATNAFCTKDTYTYTEDELSYIRSVKGEGSCKSGSYQDFPCFEDYLVFAEGAKVQMISRSEDISKVACVIRSSGNYDDSTEGVLLLTLGEGQSEVVGNTEDITISCESNSEPANFKINYRMHQAKFHIIQSSDDQCGDYILEYSPIEKAP